MTTRQVTFGAWVTCAVATLGALIFLAMGIGESTPGDTFFAGGWGGVALAFAAVAFGTVGTLIANRLPENRIGWVFCLIGLAVAIGNLFFQYADQVLYGAAPGLPGGAMAAWASNLTVPPCFGLIAVALMLFPDGRLPTPRWRATLLVPLIGSTLVILYYVTRPGQLDEPFTSVSNPVGVKGAFGVANAAGSGGFGLMSLGCILALAAMITRMRRAQGLEKQQLKLVAFAAAVAGSMPFVAIDLASSFFDGPAPNGLRSLALGIGFTVIPVASGLAILRYRLYDIDVVINRALVYGSLTALLAGTYLGSVLLLQLLLDRFTQGSGLAVAASTLATAALVRPARARIQAAVDRRFFRRKYDAARILGAFGSRLREQVDLDSLTTDLRSVVTDTMQPAHVSLWTPTGGGAR